MGTTTQFLNSSVGRKVVMALSGLFLCSFLIVHLTINLFALNVKNDNGDMFNTYGHFMATHPIIRPLEWGLFAGFLLHAVLGIALTIRNRQARPVQYAVNKVNENSSWVSRLSWLTGVLVGVFLVVHINTFFVQSRFFDHRPMIELIKDAFASGGYVLFYVVALVFLAYHLKHGIQSAFQTLGWNVGKYKTLIAFIGAFFWLVVPIAFAIIPLYFLLWYH